MSANSGYVYIWGSKGNYKIGKAKNVKRRLESITLPPFPCELIHAIATDDAYGLESRLHWHFAEKRLEGEWFALTEDDIDYLRSLNPDQLFEHSRNRQQILFQQDPDVVEMLTRKAALQKEMAELEARRNRVLDEANEQDRAWAMVTLRTREAEKKLIELSTRLSEMENKLPKTRNLWQRLFRLTD